MKKNIPRNTIADVARHAGVSKATVSRFLNHREKLLSPQIAERVDAAINELRYVPSPMAQALKWGRSKLIGLVVADITNPFSVAVLRGAEEALRKAGYLVMLFNLGNESERESAALQALSSYKVEGFVLNAMGHDTGALLEAASQGKPVVLIDRLHPGLDVDIVALDNRHAIEECCRHLIDAGYGELMLVTEPVGKVSSRMERKQAFTQMMADAAIPGVCIEQLQNDSQALIQNLRQFKDEARAAPAIICANAVITLQVVAAAESLGWRLGIDVGLVGIDDTPWAPYVGPGITALAQPTDQIGQLAANCLLQRLGGLDSPGRNFRPQGTLMIRGSTRGPGISADNLRKRENSENG
ncbi:LacI family DNA-binding transcriptional regulator [Pusillimonas sp. ANT_WB101]|uniref:LacI family DNA-binding transcriptional regulator n=1 Tax=Pusillimonas sp. ANT_WB101 TaxID=2597356 RepID=UPI0011F011F8|nr:LacI family DNA-binding transcriptional regulator [Pusillimonas sp. ANT_WB101]KAA0910558.1 LacI family DNA-binding transcriptional regulator [Pusillimonas sp. ANT_WB101]